VAADVPAEILGYARLLTGRLNESLGGPPHVAYLHGSAVLGGWVPG
jgi:hypothetical protein